MAVNQPSPRAQHEDKVCLRCHKSLAIRAILYPTPVIGYFTEHITCLCLDTYTCSELKEALCNTTREKLDQEVSLRVAAKRR